MSGARGCCRSNAPAVKKRQPPSHFRIAGKAKIAGAEYSAIASTSPALRKSFPQMRYPPEEFDGLIALGITAAPPEPPKPAEEKRKKKT